MRMDSSRDREAFLRRRRERYRLQREREMVEEREVRLARRREYYRRRRATISTEQCQAILQQRRAAYSTNAEVDELVQSSSSSSANQVTVNTGIEFPRFDHPDIIAKMTEFHEHMDSLQSAKCDVCLEQFPNLRLDTQQSCRRCATDKHVPKLFSSQNNMNPGVVPPELTVSYQ